MKHTIGKSLSEMFVKLNLIINNKEIKKAHYFSHFPLAVSCTISLKQDIDFGNQGLHMLMPVQSFIRIERGSDGGP